MNDNAGTSKAHKFISAVEHINELLISSPGIGAPRDYGRPELEGMRMLPVPHFSKYLIFYRTTEIEIEILRVFHGAQDIERIFMGE